MDIRTQSALLAAIVSVALGLSMLLRARRPRVVTRYANLALTIGAYYAANFFVHLLTPMADASILSRIAMGATIAAGSLIPASAIAFFLEFLGVAPRTIRRARRVAALSAVFGVAVAVTPLAEKFWARIGIGVWVLAALTACVSLLIARVRQLESRIERLRLMYLAIGAAASLLFSALDFLSSFDIPFPGLGPIVSTLYLFFLAQTILRLRLMDLHELLGKFASQTVLATMLAAVFAVLTAWVGNHNRSLYVFNTALAALVILILLDPLRTWVEERVVAIFFRERYELLRSLANLRARMVNVIEVPELAALVLDAINETRRVTHASVYLLADDRPGYRLLAFRGPQPAPFLDAAAARGLLHATSAGQKAVLLENLDRRTLEVRGQSMEGKRARDEIKRINDTRSALQQMCAGIAVPLVGGERVIGFLNLWDERVPEAYASDEIALILQIAERFATVVENSKLYDQMRERDRLAALGEMAAGLAHEIRNPLGAIKGAAQCLDPQKLPGEDGEFLEVIVEEVNRLNGVVSAFLDYSRPLKQNFGPTDLNEVVSRTTRLIQNDIPKSVTLELDLAYALPRVDGDAEQLKQVLINLIQNAIQALGTTPGKLTVRTVRPERFGDLRGAGEHVEVHVTDDGPGIPADHQEHIFVPFYTTKEKGTGLGLAICQRIVKNHSGAIAVQSRMGEGTTFVIRMPALQSDLDAQPLPEGTPYPGTLLSPVVSTAAKEKRKKRRKSA